MTWFYVLIAILPLALVGTYWLWKRRIDVQLREAADYEWTLFQKNEPDFIAHLNPESFYNIFHRVHFPRFPGYALACAITFTLSLPIIFIALSGLLWLGIQMGIIPEPIEVANQLVVIGETFKMTSASLLDNPMFYVAEDIGGFYYFFGVLAAWLVIVSFFMRHYHKNRPGYLRDEIIRTR